MIENSELVGKTYHIKTFGCQMNLHDTERVSGLLEACGCNEVIKMTISASSVSETSLQPQASSKPETRSVSCRFIWQPKVFVLFLILQHNQQVFRHFLLLYDKEL